MAITDHIQQMNHELANKLLEEAQRDPQSPYANKKLGIANGRVVVIADNWDEVARQLKKAEPDPAKRFCIDTSVDYNEVQEIWEVS